MLLYTTRSSQLPVRPPRKWTEANGILHCRDPHTYKTYWRASPFTDTESTPKAAIMLCYALHAYGRLHFGAQNGKIRTMVGESAATITSHLNS